MKGHVPNLRDARWEQLRFTNAGEALATLAAFVDAPSKGFGLVEMRNLRARVDGLLKVSRGYQQALNATR